MSNEADEEHRSDQISRTFALLTARLEDAAALAVEGQGRHADERIISLAERIAELSGEVATIAQTLAVLLARPSRETSAP